MAMVRFQGSPPGPQWRRPLLLSLLCACTGLKLVADYDAEAAKGITDTSAEVFAECWMPFGHHEQICSEGIEIIADPLDFAGVSGLIAGLRAADLPRRPRLRRWSSP